MVDVDNAEAYGEQLPVLDCLYFTRGPGWSARIHRSVSTRCVLVLHLLGLSAAYDLRSAKLKEAEG